MIYQRIVFTDLDGTLLDHHTYSFDKAIPALNLLKRHNIPLVICTSKTRAEIEYWREHLHNTDPFISENGGGVYIPKQYFSSPFIYDKETEKYHVFVLGEHITKLRAALSDLQHQFNITNFLSLPDAQIKSCTNMTLEQVHLAKQREYDIPFLINDPDERDAILNAIKQQGFTYTKGGRFYHILGNANKGTAVRTLIQLFQQHYGRLRTIGIGDSANDFPMLDVVDQPYLVQQPNGMYASSKYHHTPGKGAEGWNAVIATIISENAP